MINARELIGTANVLFVTFDSLRYDVARAMMHAGRTPNLENVVAGGLWEERRTMGSFTYPAHAAFFAGFFPVPSGPRRPPRLMACRAIQGKTIVPTRTYVFDAPDIVTGLAGLGYRTVSVGGVGFFSSRTPLGRVFPSLFQESHWVPDMAAEEPHSTRNQVRTALETLERLEGPQKMFLFMNITATHTPTHFYLHNGEEDTWESQAAALTYADTQLGPLFEALPQHGQWLAILCADHGEAFGEDGYTGHGVIHSTVMTVPYSESVIPQRPE
jgi:arylsulfatase A-like enzyme